MYLDTFEEYMTNCKDLLNFKYRRDFVRDVLFDLFERDKVYVKKWKLVNLLSDPQKGKTGR